MSHPDLLVSIPFYINTVLSKDVPLVWDTKELLLEGKKKNKQDKTRLYIYIYIVFRKYPVKVSKGYLVETQFNGNFLQ